MKTLHALLLAFLTIFGTAVGSKFPGYTFMFDPVREIKVDVKDGKGSPIVTCMRVITDYVDPVLDNLDLNQFGKTFAECIVGYLIGGKPQTVALYGELLSENAKYDGYKLSLEFNQVKYDSEEPTPSDATVILVKWIHNEQNNYIGSLIEEEYTTTTTTTVTSIKGITMSGSATVGVSGGDPLGIVKASASVTVSGSSSTDRESTSAVTHTHTFALAENITVCPRCSVQTIWTMNQGKRKVYWSAFIEITGWIMVKLASPYEGSNVWAIPIGDMAFYCPEYFERISPLQMNYLAKGVFEDAASIDSVVTAVQFPVDGTNCNN